MTHTTAFALLLALSIQKGVCHVAPIWAYLSEDAENRLCGQVEAGSGARLKPDDWISGDRLWLVEMVTLDVHDRDKFVAAMLDDLVKTVFAGKTFKFHAADTLTGKREIREVKA